MTLVKGLIAKDLAEFIKSQNTEKVTDTDIAIDRYCDKLETKVFEAIKLAKIDITIPSGAIIVAGANGGGPVICTNSSPIVLSAPLTDIKIS